jgi:Fungal Zn(2)-Cys(6) binuclear cluster domain
LICDGLHYPCTTCREDDTRCTLITPQERKGACQRCKRQKIKCSYSHDGGLYARACDGCIRENKDCIAGPVELSRTDIQQNLGCKNCRKHKIHCSVRANFSAVPCSNCLNNSITCSFKALSKPKNTGTTQRKQLHKRSLHATGNFKRPPASKTHQPFLKVSLADTRLSSERSGAAPLCRSRARHKHPNRKATEKTILTSYCHPIKFNWVPPARHTSAPYSPENLMQCHFCTDPGISYGLCGLGERSVRVVDWPDPYFKGYEERGEGWYSGGEENSRMCLPCTMERLLIMSCAEHRIRPINGLDPNIFDFDKPYRQILEKLRSSGMSNGTIAEGDVEKQEANETKWCSICIAPAFFECCVCPSFNKFGDPTTPGGDYGCGLLLCEICASRLTGSPSGGQEAKHTAASANRSGIDDCSINAEDKVSKATISLDRLIAAATNDPIHYEVGLRADVGFLSHDGELRRFVDAENRDKDAISCHGEKCPCPYSTPGATKSTKHTRRPTDL